MKNIILSLVICLFIGVSYPAGAKKKVKVTTIGSDIQTLQATVTAQGTAVATVQNQVNEVVDKFQTMNGDVGRNFKKNKDQDKVLSDVEIRLQVMEDKTDLLTSQLSELRSEGLMQPKSSQRFREYKEYARGLEYMNAKQYDKAIKEFTKFKTQYKKSIYQSFAQYWIGEAYYMQSDYPMAIKQYQKLLSRNPKSAKASTALYRQGLSFYYLQSLDDAKAFFSKVIRSYPKSIEAIQSSAQLARIKKIQLLRKQHDLEMKMVN